MKTEEEGENGALTGSNRVLYTPTCNAMGARGKEEMRRGNRFVVYVRNNLDTIRMEIRWK
jgi:hypothetical protein